MKKVQEQDKKKGLVRQKFLAAIFAVAVIGTLAVIQPAQAMAAEKPLVTVYEHINRGGASQSYYQTNLYRAANGTLGIADKSISSIEVHEPVTAILCENDNLLGRRIFFPKGFYNLTDYDFNDRTSVLWVSVENNYITFFEHTNEEGMGLTASSSPANLVPSNFNDVASSVYVPSGKAVILYEHDNFEGKSLTLSTGVHNLTNYLMTGTTSWNDQMSSYKVITWQEAEIQKVMNRWQVLKPKNPLPAAPANIKISDHAIVPYSLRAPYVAGMLSQSYLNDGLNMFNFCRYLAGVPDDITLDSQYNSYCQYGAVLLSCEFGHEPAKPQDMSQTFYEIAFRGTSNSNCGSGSVSLDDQVRSFMWDLEYLNLERVGHRRWMLNPEMKKTGFGFVVTDSNNYAQYPRTYSTLYTADRSRTEEIDFKWIAWPGKGENSVFPKQLFYKTVPWSITLNRADYLLPQLNEVQVTLTETATHKTWTFSSKDNVISAGKYFNVDSEGYGHQMGGCIIFRPDGISEYNGTYHVSIKGVKDRYSQPATIEYDVTFFDMDQY